MLYYRSAEDQPFEKIIKTTWKDNFQILGFNYQSKNENDAYVLTNTTSDTNEIVLYDLKKKKTIKKVYSNDTFDVGGMSRSIKETMR